MRRQPGATFLRDLRPGLEHCLDLSAAHPGGIAQLYAARPTKLSSLLRETTSSQRGIQLSAALLNLQKQSLEKHGINPLRLISGIATWSQLPTTPKNQATTPNVETLYCPVLERPIWINKEKNNDYGFNMGSTIRVNPILINELRRRGIEIDTDQITNMVKKDKSYAPHLGLELLRELGSNHLPGFELREEVLIAPTGSVAQILKNDYDHWRKAIHSNPLILALASDTQATKTLQTILPPDTGQDRPPGKERGITDLDPSQIHAIECVATGTNLFIDLPPGAPTAQTVAAILADAAASNRHVTYLPGAPRRAALVKEILTENHLNEYLLELHDAEAITQKFTEKLRSSLRPSPVTLDISYLRQRSQELAQAREKLENFTGRLHTKRKPWGVSAYDALQALADLTAAKPGPRTKIRIDFNNENAPAANSTGRQAARVALKAAAEAGILDPEHIDSPWKGAVISTPAAANAAIERVERLVQNIPLLRERLVQVVEQTGLVAAPNLAAWAEQIRMLQGVVSVVDIFKPEIFQHSAADMVIATASRQWRKDRSIPMSYRQRRQLIKQAKDNLRPAVSVKNLHAALVEVQNHRDVWRRHALPGAWPRVPNNFKELLELSEKVFTDAKDMAKIINPTGIDLEQLPFQELETHLKELSNTCEKAKNLPTEIKLLGTIHDLGLDPLLADMQARGVPPNLALEELDLAWWSGILSAMIAQDPIVSGYDDQALRELSQTWRELDLAQIHALSGPIRAALYKRATETLTDNPELATQLSAALEENNQMAPNQIIKNFPELTQLLPIWSITPVLLSELCFDQELDLLVIDHLDQVPSWQLAPILARARQVVVCADSRRYRDGFNIQAAAVLPKITVTSQATSMPEQVAAFLAEHGYGTIIRPVPAPAPDSLVRLETVDGRAIQTSGRGAGVPAAAEVCRVTELVMEHAKLRPEDSLAVVCLNPEALPLIRQAVREAAAGIMGRGFAGDAAQKNFFNPQNKDPFVITDTANVAGLQRDVLILCVGVAKSNHGKVVHDFGPISTESGCAHLIDALEVARKELIVTASFTAQEIDPARVTQPGSQMLVDLLYQAGTPSGMTRALLTEASFESEPDRLLVDLAERLWRRGLTVVPRFGLPQGIKVPLAIGHADLPTELLVAVLSDDENYVAEPSLRRKERYWPERLRKAGWEVVTVYSSQVFADPQKQADMVYATVQRVLERRHQDEIDKQTRLQRQNLDPAADNNAKTDNLDNAHDTTKSEHTTETESNAQPKDTAEQVDTDAQKGDTVEINGSAQPSSQTDPQTAQRHLQVVHLRKARPPIAAGLPLSAYGDDQLDEIYEWVCSDQVERTEDEQVEQLRQALGLHRRGAQVDAVLRNVVRRRELSEAENNTDDE